MNNKFILHLKTLATVLVFVLSFLNLTSFGQQTNNWYFGSPGVAGKGLRIDFSSGTAVVYENYPLVTLEGSSSISDASGNPLFYTDGTRIWDASTNTTFSTTLLGGSSSTQSATVMPKPGATNEWLVFTSGETNGASGTNGINYYTVSGTPGSFSISGPTNLVGTDMVGEGLCIIGSTKPGSSFWVIARDNDNLGRVRAWDVSNTGVVNATPIISTLSNTGWTQTDYTSNIGTIKSNTCQNKLAFTYFNTDIDLVDFDTETGSVVANTAIRINIPAPIGNSGSYGIEFSPNDAYLYATNLTGRSLLRYDINAGTTNASFGTTTHPAGQLQIAPDGKIYMGIQGDLASSPSYLGVISNPSAVGATFSETGLQVSPVPSTNGFAYWGLPTFPKSLIVSTPSISPGDGIFCINENIPVSYSFGGYAKSQTWTVSPATGWSFSTGTATSVNPTITFTTAGIYTVTVDVVDECDRHYIQDVEFDIREPKIPAGAISCATTSLTFNATGTDVAEYPNYVWYDAATGGNILGVGTPVTLNYASMAVAPTSVWVEIADNATIASSGSNSIGPSIAQLNYSGGLSSGTQGLSVLAGSVTLKSFQVLTRAGASYGGNFTVTIQDASSNTVFSQVYNVTGSAGGTTYTVDLNKTLGTGNYTISISGAAQWMMKSSAPLTYTNTGQLALGTSSPYPILANLQYDYTNFSITPTCTQRIRVDRKCLIILPGDGTYCTGTDIPLSYTFEGTAVSQAWSITPGTAGVDWVYVAPSTSTSLAPIIRFINTGNYTITVNVTDNTSEIHTQSMLFNITPGTNPNGVITCNATSMTLTASGTPASDYPNYVWYSAATGGDVLGIGSPVTLNYSNPASAPASVWVEVAETATVTSSGSNSAGPGTSGGWSAGAATQSHNFSVLSNSLTVNSIQVGIRQGSTSYTGPFTVTIRDASNAVVFTQGYTVPSSATPPPFTANINTNLSAGNYTITIASGGAVQFTGYAPWGGVTNAGQISLSSGNYLMGIMQYNYSNYTIVPKSCINRVRVDRLCTLPIELISFTGENSSTGNVLNWSTSSEINNNYFQIQHSTDGINFTPIGTVAGHGNSTSINEYQFIDRNPTSGINYYRLVQVDFDGKSYLSNTIRIYSGFTNVSSFVVSPNPSNSSFAINFTDLNGGQISVTDILGRELLIKSIESGTEIIEIGESFAKGSYIVRFTGLNGISTQLIIKD